MKYKRQQYDKAKARFFAETYGPEYLAAKQNVVRIVNEHKLWPILFDLTNDERCDWLHVERVIMQCLTKKK